MTFEDVLEQLNNGKPMDEVAVNTGLSVRDLERKLVNAAIEFDEEKNLYEYKGIAPEQSLIRDVKSRIVVLQVDKPYVKKDVDNRQNKVDIKNIDMEYILFKDYHKVDKSLLTEKKTFFLTEEMYNNIKKLSVEKSFRINALVNVLLAKGLEQRV